MTRPSLMLRTTGLFLMPLLLMFSLFMLLRGHNLSGGGFIAGLIAAGAIALHLFLAGIQRTQRFLLVDPRDLMGAGLLMALGSGIWQLLVGQAPFTSAWGSFTLPLLGKVKLGTPLLFDLGVYCVVVGAVLAILLNLAESEE